MYQHLKELLKKNYLSLAALVLLLLVLPISLSLVQKKQTIKGRAQQREAVQKAKIEIPPAVLYKLAATESEKGIKLLSSTKPIAIKANTPFSSKDCSKKALGDTDCNDLINKADLAFWEAEYKSNSGIKNSDFNKDGTVDLLDFETWRKNYTEGNTLGITKKVSFAKDLFESLFSPFRLIPFAVAATAGTGQVSSNVSIDNLDANGNIVSTTTFGLDAQGNTVSFTTYTPAGEVMEQGRNGLDGSYTTISNGISTTFGPNGGPVTVTENGRTSTYSNAESYFNGQSAQSVSTPSALGGQTTTANMGPGTPGATITTTSNAIGQTISVFTAFQDGTTVFQDTARGFSLTANQGDLVGVKNDNTGVTFAPDPNRPGGWTAVSPIDTTPQPVTNPVDIAWANDRQSEQAGATGAAGPPSTQTFSASAIADMQANAESFVGQAQGAYSYYSDIANQFERGEASFEDTQSAWNDYVAAQERADSAVSDVATASTTTSTTTDTATTSTTTDTPTDQTVASGGPDADAGASADVSIGDSGGGDF